MGKLQSLIYKDFLLLVRDRAGLCMLFLMPTLLVVIMAYLQNSTFNSISETRIPLLLVNNDRDSLGMAIERQIMSSSIFEVNHIDSRDFSTQDLQKAVADGKYMLGIIIPEGATNEIRKNVKRYVTSAFNGVNINLESDSAKIEIFLDPTVKSSFRNTLNATMREYAIRTESEFLFKEIIAEVNKISPVPVADVQLSHDKVIIEEKYAQSGDKNLIPNSTQHNVPAWSLFAIFFIAISLSGNIIKERDEGSFTRLQTMPCPYSLYILGKIITYLGVCVLQLVIIFAIGIYIFPLLNLPALMIGGKIIPLAMIGICSALAAIGYGVAIGKFATTHQQAAIFASVSVVILAAVGGVWIPTFIMPKVMQYVSAVSPMNWGLGGFYDVLLRQGKIADILPECLFLLLFFAVCITAAIIYNKKKRIDL